MKNSYRMLLVQYGYIFLVRLSKETFKTAIDYETLQLCNSHGSILGSFESRGISFHFRVHKFAFRASVASLQGTLPPTTPGI